MPLVRDERLTKESEHFNVEAKVRQCWIGLGRVHARLLHAAEIVGLNGFVLASAWMVRYCMNVPLQTASIICQRSDYWSYASLDC